MIDDGDLFSETIDFLVESDFIPGKHEAYAYVMDSCIPANNRVTGVFARDLNALNWDTIEANVAEIKHMIA